MAGFLANVVETLQSFATDVSTAVVWFLSSGLANNLSGCFSTEASNRHKFLSRNSCSRMTLDVTVRVEAILVL